MSNFGCFDLRLVNAYRVAVDEARSAVNAGAVIQAAREHSTIAEAVEGCTLVVGTTSIGNRELQHPLRRLETAATLIREHWQQAPDATVAILFGSEKFGLSNDDLSHCHWLLRIPSREEHGSMNLGQAVAVTLYELVARSEEAVAAKPALRQPAPADQLERFTELLLEALRQSGYVQGKTAASTERKIRRMVMRLQLPSADAIVWQGMMRQILWKLGVSAAAPPQD